jgi:amphi-Trp domain-containing protein
MPRLLAPLGVSLLVGPWSRVSLPLGADAIQKIESVDIGDSLIGADCVSFTVPEEVLFKSESNQSREEIASYLRKVADNLDSGSAISLKSGSESVTLNPPARPTFEVKAEREGPAGDMTELSIEFELEWNENAEGENSGSSQLEIE